MMMSAMMAAKRMRKRLMEGPQLHGPRSTIPSAAAAQRHQQTSPQRRVAGTWQQISVFVACSINDLMQSCSEICTSGRR